MQTYFVHNQEQNADYIVIPGKTVLSVTPKIFSEFLYAQDLSTHPSEFTPQDPKSLGTIVAVLEGNHLRIMDSDLWADRRQSMEW